MHVFILEREVSIGDIDTIWTSDIIALFESRDAAKRYAQSEWVKGNPDKTFESLQWVVRDDPTYESTVLDYDRYHDSEGDFIIYEMEVLR